MINNISDALKCSFEVRVGMPAEELTLFLLPVFVIS